MCGGGGGGCCRFFLSFFKRRTQRRQPNSSATTPPTAIPATAPPLSPDDSEWDNGGDESRVPPGVKPGAGEEGVADDAVSEGVRGGGGVEPGAAGTPPDSCGGGAEGVAGGGGVSAGGDLPFDGGGPGGEVGAGDDMGCWWWDGDRGRDAYTECEPREREDSCTFTGKGRGGRCQEKATHGNVGE
jgi:hypothetical protein